MEGIIKLINQELDNNIIENEIAKHKVDLSAPLPPREVAWEIKAPNSEQFEILGTLGNFSLIKGKAKSRKSFLLSMAVIIISGIIYGKWTKEDFAGLQIVLHDTIDRYLSCYKL